jgi:hypothetical protein
MVSYDRNKTKCLAGISACLKIKTLPNMQKSGKYLKQQIFSLVKKVVTKNVI